MNTLKQKVGPFALWVWLVIITIVVIGYSMLKGGSSGLSSLFGGSSSSSTTPASSTPDFVIQNQYLPEPVTGPTSRRKRRGSNIPTEGDGAPEVQKGWTELTEAEATAYKRAGATIKYLDHGKFANWSGPGSVPGASLWVRTSWLHKHHKHPKGNPAATSAAHKAPTVSDPAMRGHVSRVSPPPPDKHPVPAVKP